MRSQQPALHAAAPCGFCGSQGRDSRKYLMVRRTAQREIPTAVSEELHFPSGGSARSTSAYIFEKHRLLGNRLGPGGKRGHLMRAERRELTREQDILFQLLDGIAADDDRAEGQR